MMKLDSTERELEGVDEVQQEVPDNLPAFFRMSKKQIAEFWENLRRRTEL